MPSNPGVGPCLSCRRTQPTQAYSRHRPDTKRCRHGRPKIPRKTPVFIKHSQMLGRGRPQIRKARCLHDGLACPLGGGDVTHATSQSYLPTSCPALNGERSSNTTPKRRLLNDTSNTGKPGEKSCHVCVSSLDEDHWSERYRRGDSACVGMAHPLPTPHSSSCA